jgi:hypothetical protein
VRVVSLWGGSSGVKVIPSTSGPFHGSLAGILCIEGGSGHFFLFLDALGVQ